MIKKFTSNLIKDICYVLVGEGWMDKNTYVMVFSETIDADGDSFHVEVEYHKDEDEIIYTRVYDDETMDASDFISPCFKNQFEEYILRQVGVVEEDSVLVKRNITLNLTIEAPMYATIAQLENYLNDVTIKVVTPNESKFNIIKAETINKK